MAAPIQLIGFKELERQLREMDRRGAKNAARAAMRAGLKPMVKTARGYAPKRSGALQKSIRVKSTRVSNSTGELTGRIGFKNTKQQKQKGLDAFYGHMVVGGTKRHRIPKVGVAGQVKALLIGGRLVSQVTHPGAKPNPFMERASRDAFRPSVRAFGQRLRIEIDKRIGR